MRPFYHRKLYLFAFDAQPGEILGVTGPVACGKSTFGRVFLCEAPYGGSVKFGGKELSALTPRQIAATVGYLGHDPELSADTVENNRCDVLAVAAANDRAHWLEDTGYEPAER